MLGVTLVLTTASLVFWWTILLRGEMRNNEFLERELLRAAQSIDRDSAVTERQAELARTTTGAR